MNPSRRRWLHGAGLSWLGLAAPAACRRSPAQQVLDEFSGAYPRDPRPNGVVRQVDLVAAPAELPLLDGGKLRVWAYNGQVPGPTIRMRLGETLRARFVNELPEPSTIHWHGVRVPNGMDGVPHLTQPPVAPGGAFTYEFTPKDAGTFWFHPHIRSSEQVERGLYGVLIVEDEHPAPYDQDVVWVLDDWLLDEQRQIFGQFNTMHDLMHDGRWGNVVTVNGRTTERLVVQAGQRVRLRLINSANGRIFRPDLGALDARIIAVDGSYLRQAIPYRGFELAPGNRLDLDLRIGTAASGVLPLTDRFYERVPNHLGDLVVDGIAAAVKTFPPPARARVPTWRGALGRPVTKRFTVNARRGGEHGIEWTFNDQAFAGHHHQAPPALSMEAGTFHRLQFVNLSYRLHPIHLHGMFFRLLARNGVAVDEPFFRDTVLMHGQETIDVGVVPLDAGVWMMHCHILEHAEAGMMTTLAVTPPLNR